MVVTWWIVAFIRGAASHASPLALSHVLDEIYVVSQTKLAVYNFCEHEHGALSTISVNALYFL